MPGGKPPRRGGRIVFEELGRTLRTIAQEGACAFYEGAIGQAICEHVGGMGGILTGDDLAAYRAHVREPLYATYRGYGVFGAPLPNGGISVLQALNVLECFQLAEWECQGPQFVHTVVEALKLVRRDRMAYFGDPDFVAVHVDRFLSKQYAAKVRRKIGKEPVRVASVHSDSGSEAMHLCVVDAQRNMVSLTQSHGSLFGSLVTVPGVGITLNNGLSRFDPKPGRPNSIAPRKRPLDNLCPVLIVRDSKPVAALGYAGGRETIGGALHLMVSLLDFDLTVSDALSSGRFGNEGGGAIFAEARDLGTPATGASLAEDVGDDHITHQSVPPATCDRLREMGHDIKLVPTAAGIGHVIHVDRPNGRLCSAPDPRGEGLVAAAG
jgi:gamma-glutamyltranspeptidase/glutathione hydrolase